MNLLRIIPKGKDAVIQGVEKAGASLFEKPIAEEALDGLKSMGFKEKTFDGRENTPDLSNPAERLETAMGVSRMQHNIRKKMEGPEGESLMEKLKKTDPLSKEGGDLATTLLKGWDKPLEKAIGLISKWAESEKSTSVLTMGPMGPAVSILGGFLKKSMEGAREKTNRNKKNQNKGKGMPLKPGEKAPSGQAVGQKETNEAADMAKQALGMLMQAGQLALLAIPGVGLVSSALGRGMAAGIKGVASQAVTKGISASKGGGFLDIKNLSGLAKKAASKGKESFEKGKKEGEDIHMDSTRTIGS